MLSADRFQRMVWLAKIVAATIVITLSASGIAGATGTMQVQQSDGSTQTYKNVSIVIGNKTLRLTTEDKKGTLLIDRAACYFVHKLMLCLPYSMTLDQGGGSQPLDFLKGTVYLNGTDEKLQLPASSQQLPPNGILLSLTTKIGTIVNLSGTIDKHIK